MQNTQLSSIEANFLTAFNKGHNTFESLKETLSFNEKVLSNVIETMLAKNVIKFDTVKKIYVYDSPVSGEKVILDGNIMLPVSIIKLPDYLLVTRGAFYKFPLDFDIRTIIWNVQLPNNSKSTLIDLIKESALKEKKSRIVQVEEYKVLVNKIIPWSNSISLKINAVGEDVSDVSMIFKIKLYLNQKEKTDFVEFKEFTVRSEIRTEELIAELTGENPTRIWQNIKINRIFNFSDFIFSNNCIPYLCDEESINYAKITGIRGKFEISYYRFDNSGQTEKLDNEQYMEASEGIEKMRKLFDGYCKTLIMDNDILVEMTD